MTPKERLLAAADELFYNDGVHTVGIDRVLAQAGVAKASLYSNFGSKDGLVRAYLRSRDERVRDRITKRLATLESPKERILAMFEFLQTRIEEGGYTGCPFIRASAEGPPGPNAAREVSVEHRAWRREMFETLATELGVPNPEDTSLQLSFLYDGAATSYAMERVENAPLVARDAAGHLLDAALGSKNSKKRTTRV